MSREYYVYAFIRLDTNTYFYIGKGKGIRCKRIDLRSRHFKNIIKATKCALEILYDNLTEDEALELEKNTIEDLVFNEGYSMEFDEEKSQIGHLVNYTYGGEGISGYKYTEEQRKKCSRKGIQNGMYGKRGELSPLYGREFSEEHKEKIKISNPRRKEVYCIELDITFISLREAERILLDKYNIHCSHASISAVCRGKAKYCGRDNKTNKELQLHFKYI